MLWFDPSAGYSLFLFYSYERVFEVAKPASKKNTHSLRAALLRFAPGPYRVNSESLFRWFSPAKTAPLLYWSEPNDENACKDGVFERWLG